MGMEEAFLETIKQSPRSKLDRDAFADWLTDQDRVEEADFVRSWTRDKHDEAVTWMSRFAIDMIHEDGDDELEAPDISDLITAGWKHVKDGHSSCLVGSGFWAEEQIEQDDFRKEFWYHWSMITGKPFTPDAEGEHTRDGHLFRCCG